MTDPTPEGRPDAAAAFVRAHGPQLVVSGWMVLMALLFVFWGLYGYLATLVVCVILHTALIPLDRRAVAVRAQASVPPPDE